MASETFVYTTVLLCLIFSFLFLKFLLAMKISLDREVFISFRKCFGVVINIVFHNLTSNDVYNSFS